jgi:hypothetical protein
VGGWGSGRHRYGQTNGSTDAYPSLDVRRLQRDRHLDPGQTFPYSWTPLGKRTESIKIRVDLDLVTLSDEHRGPIAVPVERTTCNYGGQRVWFNCPAEGCGRRVAILYGWPVFACRRCHNLSYRTQRLSAKSQALERAQAIRQELGGTTDMREPFPARRKGMHRRTYQNLRRLHDNANLGSLGGLASKGAPSTTRPADAECAATTARTANFDQNQSRNEIDFRLNVAVLESALVDLITNPRSMATKLRAIEFGYQYLGLLRDGNFIQKPGESHRWAKWEA